MVSASARKRVAVDPKLLRELIADHSICAWDNREQRDEIGGWGWWDLPGDSGTLYRFVQ
jgi:hypothetical protein